MHSKIRNLAVFWLISLIILSGCSAWSAPPAAPAIPGQAQTLAAQTLAAQQGMYSPFIDTPTPAPVAANTIPFEQAPANPVPVVPEPVESTPFRNDLKAGAAIPSCINAAEFVKDITIPDETVLKGNQRFTKTWRFKNAGTCAWTTEYAVVFVWGIRMGAPDRVPLAHAVSPGEEIDISVPLMAPKYDDYYQGNWMFQDNKGENFGTGYRARNYFWVAISVGGGGMGRASNSFCGGGG